MTRRAYLLLVLLELGRRGLLQRAREAADGVVVRATLQQHLTLERATVHLTCMWFASRSRVSVCVAGVGSEHVLPGRTWSPGNTAKLILESRSYMMSSPFLV